MFGRKKNQAPPPVPTPSSPGLPSDPMVAARLMSDVVFDKLVRPLKMERGLPSVLIASTLGALAGHAAQVAALTGVTSGDPAYAGLSLVTVDSASGKGDQYLYGDAVNRTVLEWQYSIWALVGGVNQKMGKAIPDANEIAGYVAGTLGTDRFGIPRDLPPGAPTPRGMLSLWMLGEALSKDIPHPDYIPVTFALAYQRLAQTDNVADPGVDQAAMARIMVESAVAMSKLKVSAAELGQ